MAPRLEPVSYLGTTVQAFADRPASHDALLRRAARRWPRKVAVDGPNGPITYAELDRLVTSAAIGVRRVAEAGDRIAVAMDQSLALFIVPFVASRAEVTVLLLNTSLSPSSWQTQLATADPVVVIADQTYLQAANQAALPRNQLVLRSDLAWPLDGPTDADFDEGDPDQTLAMIATSGTTGVPKMSRVTTAGLIHAAMAYIDLLGLDRTDRAFICLPLHYIGGLSAQTTTMALVGGTSILRDDIGPTGAAARMADTGATFLDAVPSWLGVMARADQVEVPTLRTLIYGGAPMPPDVAGLLAKRFPTLRLWDVWGLSETHGPATAQQYRLDAPPLPGIVGAPIAGVDVRVDSPDGSVGELLVRGLNVTPGYADDAALSAEVIVDGWLRTGDVGTIGRDGTVRLLDRAKDVIMRGGANVFSVEVEEVMCGHPDVIEAAVYGVDDGLGEEAVAATVVLQDGAELDVMALRRLVQAGIGRHAVPRRIAVADILPRNPTGKIDKLVLRRRAEAPAT